MSGPAAATRTIWPTRVAATRWPDRPAVVAGGEITTWAGLEALVQAHAQTLGERGLEPGEAIGVLGPNSLAWIVQAFAIPRAGGVLLPLNTRLAPPELAFQRRAAGGERRPDAHTILFTSGTTGRPKGAVLTRANHEASARACIRHLRLDQADRYLACIPFFHIGGLNILYRMALVGGCVVAHSRFDPEAVVRDMRDRGITRVSLTATMLRRVLDAAGPAGLPESVRTVLVGGEHADPALLARCPQARPTYGLTEACSHVTIADPGDRHTAGRPLAGYDLRIVAEDGTVLPAGTPGLIEVRGAAVMAGYLGDPRETRPGARGPLTGKSRSDWLLTIKSRPDGLRSRSDWLSTGDFGTLDAQGRLIVHARRADLILSGGENVYPAEVEAALARHPEVAECAVVGVPDERWGQAPAAFVVSAAGADALEEHLRQHLAGFKVPRRWHVLAALPRTASGKIDRAALRDQALGVVPGHCAPDR